MKPDTTDRITVIITEDPIDTVALSAVDESASGAVVTFSGIVRDHNEGRSVSAIRYECYPEMAQREAQRIVEEAREEFGLHLARIAHRVGELAVGELALFVVVSASHRREGFDAIQAIIDRVKDRVPIWKKERYADQPDRWL
jgi:molybdopterin synthase catalytic subunit